MRFFYKKKKIVLFNKEDTDVDDIDDEEAIEGIDLAGEELLAKEFSITST